MIFSPNNPAKEWIAQELAKRASQGAFVMNDLACGSGSIWKPFLLAFPNVTYIGSDTDAVAIAKAKKDFSDVPNAKFEVVDAQKPSPHAGTFDVVTTLSSLEHVVRIDKFLDTVFSLLKPGGVAYLNYDNGHFHSHDLKERLMVPISQLLAKFGIEGPYMKEVDDERVKRWIVERGGKMIQVRKHNLGGMKHLTKGVADEAILQTWFDFENRLNALLPAERLGSILGSTIIVVQKP